MLQNKTITNSPSTCSMVCSYNTTTNESITTNFAFIENWRIEVTSPFDDAFYGSLINNDFSNFIISDIYNLHLF